MPYREVADRRAAARRRYSRDATIKDDLVRRKNLVRERNRAYVNQIKAASPCSDCKVPYAPHVMQFDHLGEDKDRAIAALIQSPVSLGRLQAEIDKCELVCANCHAERTHERRLMVAGRGVEPQHSGL